MKLAASFILLVAVSCLAQSPIKHVVVIVKENQSMNSYFGRYPGVTGVTTWVTSTGVTVPLKTISDTQPNCPHRWVDSQTDIHMGKMDGFDKTCAHLGAYVQADSTTVPSYWAYARQYALANRMFAQLSGPSFPNHLLIFTERNNRVIENPNTDFGTIARTVGWGCDAAAAGYTAVSIDPTNGTRYTQAPCFAMATMGDILSHAEISWKIYAPQPTKNIAYVWNFGSYISNLWYGAQRARDVGVPQFDIDVANGDLPQVSWLIPGLAESEHAPQSLRAGMNWTVARINKLMAAKEKDGSSTWASTLIIVTWDDWGGYVDSVAPPVRNYFGLGIRVPLLVISPFAKHGYISNTVYSFDSINKTIEKLFGVRCLVTDCNAVVRDLTDMLNLSPGATPQPPLFLSAQPYTQSKHLELDGMVDEDDD